MSKLVVAIAGLLVDMLPAYLGAFVALATAKCQGWL